jgi:hypothetical protein
VSEAGGSRGVVLVLGVHDVLVAIRTVAGPRSINAACALVNLKEMNISYNMFNGLVSKNLSKLDTFNMTMVNEQGVATTLKVGNDKNSAFAADE